MTRKIGKSVCDGIALGPILVFNTKEPQLTPDKIKEISVETDRFESAVNKAKEQLQKLYEKAVIDVGEESAEILQAHQMMLEDDGFLNSIKEMIEKECVHAEYAVSIVGEEFAQIFENMDDEYMRARSLDVKDISKRVIRILTGTEEVDFSQIPASIIVAEDLTPSETIQMDKSKLLGFVTVRGSSNSHTAILARMMNIPALIGVEMNLEEIHTSDLAVLDTEENVFIINPDETEYKKAEEKIKNQREQQRLLQAMKGQKSITRDGKTIKLFANIGSTEDLPLVIENDAEGIGLFRSEFLYLQNTKLPTEEEQYEAYKKVLEGMNDKDVVIRRMDIGADNQVDYLHLEKEDNPALGYRAIRICLSQPEIFKTQLRALLRAAVHGNLAVMYPMIISPKEVERIYEILEEVKTELEAEQIPYKVPKQGIMIETPAAVMMSEELAKMVDFFSVGTNDLPQYSLAIDRQNEKLEAFYDSHHPAILAMLEMITTNAHKHNTEVGICGELGGDLELTEEFLRIGVDELSVSPGKILKLRERIRNI